MKIILPGRPYQLFFEHRPGCLYVYVGSETNSLEIATQYWVEILSLLHRRRYSGVLLDKDIAQPLAAHDVCTIVSRLAHTGHSDVSFAICDRFYDEERCKFEELVGTNRGLNLKIVPTVREAEIWLDSRRRGRNVVRAPIKWVEDDVPPSGGPMAWAA